MKNMKYDKFLEEEFDLIGDDHFATSFDTPIKKDALNFLTRKKFQLLKKMSTIF